MPYKFIKIFILGVICSQLMQPGLVAQASSKLAPQIPSVDCFYDKVAKPVYSGQLMSIDTNYNVDTEQLFETVVKIKNTGNIPWFANESGCWESPKIYLGTTKIQDRFSKFFASGSHGKTNWYSGNRIQMSTLRVNPEETAEFRFTSKAPMDKGIYREYFAPVVEGVAWLKGEAEFKIDYYVGNPEYNEKDLGYAKYIEESVNLLEIDISGEKKIEVDLSEQKMRLKIGDKVIKTFPVSSGTSKTPTPVGKMKILSKQEVRVAGKWPHYIMPKFMMFKSGGYGIHALPSLANDRGVYWREALNHIGSRRSHGCIRLLPKDADFTYEFADIGTVVQVVY